MELKVLDNDEVHARINKQANLNKIGGLILLYSLGIDLRHSAEIFNIELPIIKTINNILDELASIETEKKVSQDAFASKAIKNYTLNTFIANPSHNYGTEAIEKIRAIRGLVFYFHIKTNLVIPKKLTSALNKILKCDDSTLINYFDDLNLNVDHLNTIYENTTSDNPIKKIFATLLAYFNLDQKSQNLNAKHRVSIIHTKQASLEVKPPLLSNAIEPHINNQSKTKRESPHFDDFLRYRLKVYSRKPRLTSGVWNLDEQLHPFEFVDFIKIVSKDFLHHSQNEIQLAILLNALIGISVANLHFIPFKKTENQNLWIDLTFGHLCYNRNFVIRKKDEPTENDIFRIPLPLEIASTLILKFAKNKDAQNLAQLFETDIPLLKKQTRNYCFYNSLTSHITSQTRLSYSYSRFLLSECGDEIYSSLISIDYSISELSNMNYFVAKGERVNQICSNSYRKLGLSGHFHTFVGADIGSVLGMSSDLMLELLRNILNDANTAIASLSTRTNENALIEIHQKVAKATLMLCVISGGLRNSKHGYIANHQIDLQHGMMLISDKKNSTYNIWRPVPLATFVQKWLINYKHFLQIFAKRLSNKNAYLAQAISQLSMSDGVSEIPLFFKIESKNNIKPLASNDLKDIFYAYGLKANVGRHVIDFSLRASIGNVIINSIMGRASMGQESFGIRSCLSVEFAFNKARFAIDEYLTEGRMPEPKALSGYRFSSNVKQPVTIYRTSLAKSRDPQAKEKNVFEQCPFNEYSLLHARYFELIVCKWKKNVAQSRLGDLAISLITNDGITILSELCDVIHELMFGKIYQISEEYAIDVQNTEIGKRRVYFSYDTLLILNNLLKKSTTISNLDIENLPKQIITDTNIRIGTLHELGYEIQPSVHDLLKAASAYFSLLLPSTLCGWSDGKIKARTLRIESVARHTTGEAEAERFVIEQSANNRRLNSDRDVIDLLIKYASKTENLGSNKKRINAIQIGVQKAIKNLTVSDDLILAKYILFLISECSSIESPTTIQNHYFNIRNVLTKLPSKFYVSEEFDENELKEHLKNNFNITKSNSASINYFLKMLGSSLKVRSGVKSDKPYSELLSPNEIISIKRHITQSKHSPVTILQLKAMFEVLTTSSLRSEDITKLRVCDVHIGNPSYAFISRKAVGTKKTINADRLIIDRSNQWPSFLKLVEITRKINPKNKTAAIFSLPQDSSSFKHSDFLMSLISEFCVSATGAVSVRPHTLRHTYISSTIAQGCSLEAQKTLTPLALRLLLKELSTSSGHGDELTTISEYCSVMDRIKRDWMNFISQKFALSPNHLSSLINKNYEATARNLKVLPARNLMHKQLKKLTELLNKRIVPVDIFVKSSKHNPNIDENISEELKVIAHTRFVAASSLGLDDSIIWHLTNASSVDFEYFKECYEAYSAALNLKWKSSVDKTVILQLDKLFLVLQQNIATLNLSKKEMFTLSHSFPEDICSPWLFTKDEIQTFVNTTIINRVLNAGFDVVLTLVKPLESLIESFKNYNFTFIEVSKASRFTSNKEFKITFVPKGTKPAARPRKLKVAMFTITSSFIAHFCFEMKA